MKQRRLSCAAVLLALVIAVTSAAQLPTGTAYVVSNFGTGYGGNGIMAFDANGAITTFEPLTLATTPASIEMSPRNDNLVVFDQTALFLYDLATGTATRVAVTNAGGISWGFVDEDGGLVWCDFNTNGLYRADDLAGANTTLLWTDPIPGPNTGWLNSCCWNGSTGSYMVAKWGSTQSVNTHITNVARDGTAIGTVANLSNLSGLDWSPWTGDVFASRFGLGTSPGVLRVTQSLAVTSLGTAGPQTTTTNGIDVLDQNSITAEQAIVVEYGGNPQHLFLIDRAGNINTLNASSARFGPSDVHALGSRQLWGDSKWIIGGIGQMSLNMGVASANDSFQVALSLGHTGGPTFSVGRLHLTPDNLFLASATNVLPGLFRGFRGTLDVNGLPPVPPSVAIPAIGALRGVRVFGGAVSFDQTGITAVSNSWGITIQ